MNFKRLFFILILALASIAGAFSVYSFKGNLLLIFPKESSYKKEWKKVDSLQNKGLPKSALEVVSGIYIKAKAEKNSAQLIKAIIHRMKFEQQMEEFSLEKSLDWLQDEIKGSEFPVKNVLHSMLAETYWQYYQNNRWKFHNRSTIERSDNNDITTWDLKTIFSHAIRNYESSLKNSDSLQRSPLNTYDDVLIKFEHSKKFRPTLYDFLAHRAVDFYMNEEPDIISPAYKFELNSESYFWNYKEFVNLKIDSRDTTSLKYYAINTLQDLLRFHRNDTDPKALIDVDLKRLSFIKNKSTSEIKDSLYLNSLKELEGRLINDPSSAMISHKIAQAYFEKGVKYNPLQSEENKWFKKEALAICESTIKKFPGSEGAQDCQALQAKIKEHTLDFITEKVNLPFKPFRALVTYKNMKTIYVRIAELDIDKYNRSIERFYGEELVKRYLKLKPVKQFALTLPDDGDYQSHSTEIKLPELKPGHYVILIGSDSAFSYVKNAVSYSSTWISNISYMNRRMENGSYDFFIQNRSTGAALKGVTAQLYYEKYNYTIRKYEYVRSEKFTSDEKGYFNVPSTNDYRNFNVEFTYKYDLGPAYLEDKLQTDNGIYQYRNYKEEKQMRPRTFFFLDRAIYRPGQTVYFKGIMINSDGESNEILPKQNSTVTFYDVNSTRIAELELTTNEYGTFNGSFTAPQGVLNGQMYISNGSGSVYFSVEEYKRPKFDVSFQPVEGNYRLGEKIKVTGRALSYSGANVDGAEVKYRVVRNASFPYWWYWWRGYYPQSAQMEIANGLTSSNDTGAFFIEFNAIADHSIPKSYQPTYSYTITADVTDMNGESHSSQTYVNAAYTAINLNVGIPAMLEKGNKAQFPVYTTNMSGQFQQASGKIEIYRLKEPEKTFRERTWPQPDKFIMDKNEFEVSFPDDEYKNENNMYKWDRAEKVLEKNFTNKAVTPQLNTEKAYDSLLISNLKNWKQGVYVMEANCKDVYGENVKDVKYFTVYSNSDVVCPSNNINWFHMLSAEPMEPGEKAKFVIGTKESDVKVLYELEHKGQIIKQDFVSLNKEQKLIEIPIEEKHRGNLSVHLMFVKKNRSYVNSSTVMVPYTNKQLDIQFETFRNKLLPGQQEEWKIKIKDKKGEKVMAEMMATLYDASLDAFRSNNWYFNIYNSYYSSVYWDANHAFGTNNAQVFSKDWNKYPAGFDKRYDRFNWFGYNSGHYGYYRHDYDGNDNVNLMSVTKSAAAQTTVTEESIDQTEQTGKDKSRGAKKESLGKNAEGDIGGIPAAMPDETVATGESFGSQDLDRKANAELKNITARSDFSETAFFYPQMETDKDGSVIVKFTIPESLTKWKMMGFAHTKDLKFGLIEKQLQTQKELMVIPNPPRFFRENDKIEFSAKVSNLSDKEMNGIAQIFFYDAVTMKEITEQLGIKNSLTFGEGADGKLKKGSSSPVKWSITIPEGVSAITYKLVARAGNFTDGEEMTVPVLSNKMLVTESMPLPVRGAQTSTYLFEKFITQNNNSSTLRNHKLTLEFTSNPAWYAVQSLPYLMEYPYECSEQTFARFYANSIAAHIANSNPKIKAVFDSWKGSEDSKALLSNLEKNQELKSLILEETPWVLDAKNESERKKRLALLFDLNKMSNELGRALTKLQKMQVSNGGWPWFEGMPDDRYITQHIITGMGHLDHLGIKQIRSENDVWRMIRKGVQYLDSRIREDHEWILKHDRSRIDEDHLGYLQIQYLYARSYFKDIPLSNSDQKAFDYYKGQAQKFWINDNKYMQGMVALALHRYDEKQIASSIMKSLKETALHNEEMGMYWKENYEGYYWYQAPIESQALLIEAFDEVTNDRKAVDDLKVWLLKSKQTQNWQTTKATSEACYALLLRGTEWLSTENNVEISLGNIKIVPDQILGVKVEAGTGYFKTSWSGTDIKPEMGKVTLTKKDEGVSWGSLYWQYFEQLDKITPAKTPLSIKKQLFLQKNSPSGPLIGIITDKTSLKPGDKIKVRVELRVDRDMEYVHMKDMRASGLEPVNVISSYKWQDGLGYYESTGDAATNFFFSSLPKGTYVFEYPLVVSHNGDFSNGITSVQCMYAPEFSSHSQGIRIKVGK